MIEPARQLRVFLDGDELPAREGQSIAAALLAAGRRATRSTAGRREPRGYFCGMGICHDCLIVVDGVRDVRACTTPVRDGMRLHLQRGLGDRESAP